MSGERPTVKFITAIVADDIRREANSKEIIIGVYTSNIVFGTISHNAGMVIPISLIFETHGIGDIPVELRVTSPSGESSGIIQGVIHSQEITAPGQINTL